MFHSEGLGNKVSSLFHVHSASNLPTRASIATISFPISPALCLRNHVSSSPMAGIRAVALVLYNKSLFFCGDRTVGTDSQLWELNNEEW